jgi:hypothetical protein
VIGIGLGFGEFLTSYAVDEPSLATEQLVQSLEQSRGGAPPGRHRLPRMRPSTLEDHMADHMRRRTRTLPKKRLLTPQPLRTCNRAGAESDQPLIR